MENTSKIIKDCMLVSKAADICMQSIHRYMNDVELLSHKAELEQKAVPRAISPEAMNDPENIEAIQRKREKAKSQLARVQNFEHLYHIGALICDMNLEEHPEYFVLLGQKIELSVPFNKLHPLAKIQMQQLMELCETFLRYNYIVEAQDEENLKCDRNCGHCKHKPDTTENIPEEVRAFVEDVLGLSVNDVEIRSGKSLGGLFAELMCN